MPACTLEKIRAKVKAREETKDILIARFELENETISLDIIVILVWWQAFRTYIAQPIEIIDGEYYSVLISMPGVWQRYLKRMVRKKLGVRHLHNINPANNESRIYDLLGVIRL